MKEKGLLEEFLKNHKYDPAQKYRYTDFSVAYEPMAYMDVSPPPPRGALSLLPKATRQGLDSGLHPSLCTLPPSPCSLLSDLPAWTSFLRQSMRGAPPDLAAQYSKTSAATLGRHGLRVCGFQASVERRLRPRLRVQAVGQGLVPLLLSSWRMLACRSLDLSRANTCSAPLPSLPPGGLLWGDQHRYPTAELPGPF